MKIPSAYYSIFCENGYPMLDIIDGENGEWHIIEYLNAPTVPSLTKWAYVLTNIRNREKTWPSIKNLIENLDMYSDYFWSRLKKEEEEAYNRVDSIEQQRIAAAEKTAEALANNDWFREEYAKHGAEAFKLETLAKDIVKQRGYMP